MSCKPQYKGIRYNSLEELYNANGVNTQQAQQLYSQYLEQNPGGNIEGFKEFVNNTKSGKDVDNNKEVNNLNFNTLDSETLKALKDKKWTEEMWNSVSQIEREQAIKCISF